MAEGTRLWEPSGRGAARRWRATCTSAASPTYEELWRWSVGDLESFWGSLWERFEVKASEPYERVLDGREMPGADVVPRRAAQLRRARAAHGAPGRDRDRLRERGRRPGRALLGRAERPGGALRRRPAPAGSGARRPRGGLPAERPGDGGGAAGHREHRRHLVELRPGVRRAHGDRPLRADRAQGAARHGRLSLRRQGLRPGRARGRDRRGDPVARAHRDGAVGLGRAPPASRPSCASSRCRSTIRCGCSSRRAPRDCRRRSCRARAASCSST